MEKKVLNVKGMSCEHCVKAVTKSVSSLAGVKGVSVDLKTGTVAFNFDPAKTEIKEVHAAIEDAGFEVG